MDKSKYEQHLLVTHSYGFYEDPESNNLIKYSDKDSDEVINTIYGKDNIGVFSIVQRYMIPINTACKEDGSVTYTVFQVAAGERCNTFYHAFRRWLKSLNIDVVKYCYLANFPEVLCGKLPEGMSQK